MNIIEYENYQEKRTLDSSDFPYLTYLCSIPLDFVRVPLHWHDEMEFIYVKKGRGLISVDFMPLTVQAGDIVIISPGQLHTIEQHDQDAMEYENIIFPLTLLGSRHPDSCWEQYLMPLARRKLHLPVRISPDAEYYPAIASCLDQIDEIRRSFPTAYELLIKGKLFELFFQFYVRNLTDGADSGSGPGTDGGFGGRTGSGTHPGSSSMQARQKTLDKTRQILKYVEQNYSRKITIREIAEASGFSQSHFMKFFKTTIGTPFTAYLNDYRLTMASRLLLSSEDSILTIAGDCGFDNLSYFNRIFRQKFAMTPREFRQTGH